MTVGPLARVLEDRPLRPAEATSLFDALLDPAATDADRAALLVGVAARPRTPAELAAFAQEMRRRARKFPVPSADGAVDLCGSGGARRPSFNVSTVSAFVVAAAGTPVVKHGNRSASGRCGSSDLLEALGLPVTRSVGFARASYRRHRLAFLHAPLFHPAAHAVAPVRKRLGIPTIFNRLGPLTNPARVPYQVVGVPDRAAAEDVASALERLGVRRALSMTSAEGCDEFSPRALTTAVVRSAGRRRVVRVDPYRHLLASERRGSWDALDPPAAAEEAERILAGGDGARRGSVLLTSAAALWVADRVPTLAAGVDRAREALDSGRAEELLRSLRDLARGFATPGGA